MANEEFKQLDYSKHNLEPVVFYTRSVIFTWCVGWALLGLACVFFVFTGEDTGEWLLGGAGSLYTAQAFLAEIAGVSLDNDSFAFPARMFTWLPLATLWRTNAKIYHVRQLKTFNSPARSNPVLVIMQDGRRESLYFPNKAAKYSFLETMRNINRTIHITSS